MANPRAAAKKGRPSSYTQKTGDFICEQLMLGNSLRKICGMEGMPPQATVFRWLASNADFREQYARAREVQADYLADEIIQIADDGSNDTYTDADGVVTVNKDVIARSRLRVDARKWIASKMAPKKYGDKLDVDTTVSGTVAHRVEVHIVDPVGDPGSRG